MQLRKRHASVDADHRMSKRRRAENGKTTEPPLSDPHPDRDSRSRRCSKNGKKSDVVLTAASEDKLPRRRSSRAKPTNPSMDCVWGAQEQKSEYFSEKSEMDEDSGTKMKRPVLKGKRSKKEIQKKSVTESCADKKDHAKATEKAFGTDDSDFEEVPSPVAPSKPSKIKTAQPCGKGKKKPGNKVAEAGKEACSSEDDSDFEEVPSAPSPVAPLKPKRKTAQPSGKGKKKPNKMAEEVAEASSSDDDSDFEEVPSAPHPNSTAPSKTNKRKTAQPSGKGKKKPVKEKQSSTVAETVYTICSSNDGSSSGQDIEMLTVSSSDASVEEVVNKTEEFEVDAKKKPLAWFQAPTPQKKQKGRKRHQVEDNVQPSSSESISKGTPSAAEILAILRAQEDTGSSVAAVKAGDSDDSDWEEVEELPAEASTPQKSERPSKSVEVTLEGPIFNKKKKKAATEWDPMDWFRLQLNKFRKETQILVHKVHLLCLVAGGFKTNTVCNGELLQAGAMSLVPTPLTGLAPDVWNTAKLKEFTHWFNQTIKLDTELPTVMPFELETVLIGRLEERRVASKTELVLLFVAALRALQLDVRFVISLQPAPFKAKDLVLKNEKIMKKWRETNPPTPKQKSPSKSPRKSPKKAKPEVQKVSRDLSFDQSETKETSQSKGKKAVAAPKATSKRKAPRESEKKKKSEAKKPKPSADSLPRPRRSRSKVNYDEDQEEGASDLEEEEEEEVAAKKGKRKTANKKQEKRRNSGEDAVPSSESDFEEEDSKFRSPKPSTSVKKQTKKTPSRSSKQDGVTDEWAEVYLPSEQKWICVDVVQGEVITTKPQQMETGATKGLSYVLAYDNDNSAKDLTKKYSLKWQVTSKLVPDRAWWEDTLRPYKSLDVEREHAETEQMEAQLMERALPTSETELKNHPLYILPKHLHKYDGIYPSTAIPVGYFKGQPIYARVCVHTLHSRENWLKEGRSVKLKEEAYKWVKSRPKKNKEPSKLDLYGHWQTEVYEPPPAVDGVVPRNAYGNVDMYKPWMLPPGTVQLRLPGLNRVARKLGVDCPQAMVGWDLHHGFSHPLMDGYIVCEEHQEALTAAWQEDQATQLQREAEKKQKRMLNNWRLLANGLLIREQAKKKFAILPSDKGLVAEPTLSTGKSRSKGSSAATSAKAMDVAQSWPMNRQAEQPKQAKGKGKGAGKGKGRGKKSQEVSHLLPCEMEEI